MSPVDVSTVRLMPIVVSVNDMPAVAVIRGLTTRGPGLPTV